MASVADTFTRQNERQNNVLVIILIGSPLLQGLSQPTKVKVLITSMSKIMFPIDVEFSFDNFFVVSLSVMVLACLCSLLQAACLA